MVMAKPVMVSREALEAALRVGLESKVGATFNRTQVETMLRELDAAERLEERVRDLERALAEARAPLVRSPWWALLATAVVSAALNTLAWRLGWNR